MRISSKYVLSQIWRSRVDLSKQCSICVFDGLLPEPFNKQVLKLLFTLALWHALAKLRLHTDPSLDLLESTTELLGKEFRIFEEKTCLAFDTLELKREVEARQRCQAKNFSTGVGAAGSTPATETPTPSSSTSSTKTSGKGKEKTAVRRPAGRNKKDFSRRTYKNHSLGDYVRTIRMFGTTDSYSTEGVGLPIFPQESLS
jgi:hypothetical protein